MTTGLDMTTGGTMTGGTTTGDTKFPGIVDATLEGPNRLDQLFSALARAHESHPFDYPIAYVFPFFFLLKIRPLFAHMFIFVP